METPRSTENVTEKLSAEPEEKIQAFFDEILDSSVEWDILEKGEYDLATAKIPYETSDGKKLMVKVILQGIYGSVPETEMHQSYFLSLEDKGGLTRNDADPRVRSLAEKVFQGEKKLREDASMAERLKAEPERAQAFIDEILASDLDWNVEETRPGEKKRATIEMPYETSDGRKITVKVILHSAFGGVEETWHMESYYLSLEENNGPTRNDADKRVKDLAEKVFQSKTI